MRLVINSLVVAGLTVSGLFAFVYLPEFTLKPLKWAGQHFDTPITTAFWLIYTVLVWALLAGVIARCMLYLKPRNVVLYGLVSAATFIVTSQSWSLVTNVAGYVRELVLVLAIPLLYWTFAHLEGKGNNKSSKSDNISAGAS